MTEYSSTHRPYDFFSSITDYHRVINQISDLPVMNEVFDKLHMEYCLRELANAITVQDWDQYMNRYQTLRHHILSKNVVEASAVLKQHVAHLVEILSLPFEKAIY